MSNRPDWGSGNYVSGNPGTQVVADPKPKPLCQWPGCNNFSVIQVQQGMYNAFHHLCKSHRTQLDTLPPFAHEKLAWQEKRSVYIGPHLEGDYDQGRLARLPYGR